MTCQTVFGFDTLHFADAVEWSPDRPTQLACGTYQLDEATQLRQGRLLLFHSGLGAEEDAGPRLLAVSPLRAGVLDLSWMSDDRLATADASGHASLFRVACDAAGKLQEVARVSLTDEAEVLALSVDAGTRDNASCLCLSDSAGHLTLVDVAGERVVHRWKAHDFESWCTAMAPLSPGLVMSGGDDCRLRLWDLRSGQASGAGAARFDMGVTCGAWHPLESHLLAVGSYDERVTLWDHRALRTPCAEAAVGGGVWRLKWCRHSGRRLLAAAMHAGFKVLAADKQWRLSEMAHYGEHGSLAYGADWSRVAEDSYLVGTCSFYDHAFKMWELKLGS